MKPRLDVLYLFHGEGHGGDAKAAVRLAALIRDSGLTVRCAIDRTQPHADKFIAQANSHGIPCDLLSYFDSSSRLKRWAGLARYLRKTHARILHVHTGDAFIHRPMAIAAWLGHRGRRLATLHWLRSPIHTEQRHIREQEFSEKFFDAILVPTEYARRLYRGQSRPQSKVSLFAVGNSISRSTVSPQARHRIREELCINPQARVILFASLLNHRKRPLDAIKAFALVAHRREDLVLLIAGTGDLEMECREAAAGFGSRIKFLGYRDDIDEVMRASDIHLLTSGGESFGLSVLDAMANGMVSVCYNIDPLLEVVGVAGLQFLGTDICQLTEKLELALDQPTLRERAQADGLRRAGILFYEDIARLHLALYRHSDFRISSFQLPEERRENLDEPFVAVIIPAYKHASVISEAIQSALDQEYSNIEVIVIDDGSPDNTGDVVAGFSDSRLHYLRQENAGQASARNLGIRLSTARYIKFLDDDDILLPDAIMRQVKFLESHPAYAGVMGDVVEFWPDSTEMYRKAIEFNWKNILFDCPVLSPGATTFRRDALLAAGCLDSRFPGVDDHDLYLRLVQISDVALIPGVVLKYRRHSANASWSMDMFDLKRRLLRYHLRSGTWPSKAQARTIVGRMLYKFWGRPAIREIRDGIVCAKLAEVGNGAREICKIVDFIALDALLWYRVTIDLMPDSLRSNCLRTYAFMRHLSISKLKLKKFLKAG